MSINNISLQVKIEEMWRQS